MKIVINACHGGFDPPWAAMREIAKRKGLVASYSPLAPDVQRTVYGDAPIASGRVSELRVVEVPDDVEWEIEEYDGREWVSEKHRTWS